MAKKAVENSVEDKVVTVDFDQTFEKDYRQYGFAVLKDRATPNVLDGLKPVQRRLLYAMHDLKLSNKAKYMKATRITGQVMALYHPHGDTIGSLDYMTEDFVFWLPPVDGNGSWTDMMGNPGAAARYVEARLSSYGDMLLNNVNDRLVPYVSNYDNSTRLPAILPARIPMMLINGVKRAIQVGLTANMPTHNPVEALRLVNAYLKNSDLTLKQALKIMPGPDFPTGGVLIGDMKDYYQTGHGRVELRARIIDDPDNKDGLIITEVPYLVGGQINDAINNIKELIDAGELPLIKSIDEANEFDDKTGKTALRIEVTLTKHADHAQARALLLANKRTGLRINYSMEAWALDGKDHVHCYTLFDYLKEYTDFQHHLMINEFQQILDKCQKQLKIDLALLTIPANLTAIIDISKKTAGKNEMVAVLTHEKTIKGLAKETKALLSKFNYDIDQASAIADRRLYQLSHLDTEALKNEAKDLRNKIYWSKRYVKESELRDSLLIKRNEELIRSWSSRFKRRTSLLARAEKIEIKKLLPVKKVTITFDRYGYLKKTDEREVAADKNIRRVLQTDNDDILAVFTNDGQYYQLPVKKLKSFSTRSNDRGESIYALLNDLDDATQILYLILRSQFVDQRKLVFVTEQGLTKQVSASQFLTKTLRKKAKATKLLDNDRLIFVGELNKSKSLLTISENNRYKRINVKAIKSYGSTSVGAKTMVAKDSKIAFVSLLTDEKEINFNERKYDLNKLPLLKASQQYKTIES